MGVVTSATVTGATDAPATWEASVKPAKVVMAGPTQLILQSSSSTFCRFKYELEGPVLDFRLEVLMNATDEGIQIANTAALDIFIIIFRWDERVRLLSK